MLNALKKLRCFHGYRNSCRYFTVTIELLFTNIPDVQHNFNTHHFANWRLNYVRAHFASVPTVLNYMDNQS